MQIVAYTSLGIFKSKIFDNLTEEAKVNIRNILKASASGNKTYLEFETADGFTILGENVLKESVFCLVDNDKINYLL